MNDEGKPRLVGLNHIALEVGDVEAALVFYGRIFQFELRGSHEDKEGRCVMAFIDMGDQFLALSQGRMQGADDNRHFGLVVDDRSRVNELAMAGGARPVNGAPFNYLDPWGNRIEIVDYRDVQFSKRDAVMAAMGLNLEKSEKALAELASKNMR